MATIKMSSDEARSKWREVLDTAVAGNQVVIERYGKPVAVIVPHAEFTQTATEENVVQEAAAIYQTRDWETVKAELLAELKQELMNPPSPVEPAKMVHVYSPRLVRREQVADFKKEIVTDATDADL
ncbi:MAG: type II toxin-antitoxin system prevent-host-death family antitoxin [Anaerolineales bacterium]|nr:type II toxin-antitoxin system prevent-host-death family antitoxin [Anaerolineales bacterium]